MSVEESILAAARECFMERGVRQTTMAAIARAAGVSRPTVYSYFGNVENLVRKVLTRETVGLLDAVYPPPRDVDVLSEGITTVALKARDNEFLSSMVSKDPELLLTYQFQRLGESQEILVKFLKNVIARMQREGVAIREGDPKVIATHVFMVAQSLVLSAKVLGAVVSSDEEWAHELTAILKGYLRQ
ncbi:TetR/AcrR family transcriptional regulator [Corynebacterium lowii]|uniref:HTH-type transcriptional repressor BepR n=2 Tax=Corynebacterium lowii TaxID=1544413 RepID=A0A0Q0YXZ3_9CORY|nr:TetR/AcrR family transcriptional regulator [Corynebacterium lowii]KQB87249.1 HTH-type transcriptional repressor BepR [Corynebacterium lowii]MDP9852164.1 AcrR family transcriptional regulator [Corynebacterium lowii]